MPKKARKYIITGKLPTGAYWGIVLNKMYIHDTEDKVFMMPTLLLLVALEVVIMTTSSATNDNKVGIIKIPVFNTNDI